MRYSSTFICLSRFRGVNATSGARASLAGFHFLFAHLFCGAVGKHIVEEPITSACYLPTLWSLISCEWSASRSAWEIILVESSARIHFEAQPRSCFIKEGAVQARPANETASCPRMSDYRKPLLGSWPWILTFERSNVNNGFCKILKKRKRKRKKSSGFFSPSVCKDITITKEPP